jgi:DNA mismatch repair protein MutL
MSVATQRQPRIKPLSTLVANQIAAGEVVERPASVVKELLENALDAEATRVTIELEQGGVELVRVSDDGNGIHGEDLALAVAPHATSKIAQANDLDHIATLGFRGEALASIASVSRMSLRSRTHEAVAASELEVEGSTIRFQRPAAGSVGTSVSVRNLFFNTPARRKFLRTVQTEKERCLDMVEQLAIAHPAVGFSVIVDGKRVHELSPNQGPKERVLAILGKELEAQLIGVHADRFDDARGVALWGMAGLPSLARGSMKSQLVFVNGRCVRDRTIQHAIAEAYRGLIEPGRHPTVVLMLDMSPEGVDVNVHPQKAEVRFRDSSMVHSVVLRALREALQRADLTPRVSDLRSPMAWGPGVGGAGGASSAFAAQGLLGAQAPTAAGLPGGASPQGGVSEAKFAAFFSRFRPGEGQLPLNLAAGLRAQELAAGSGAAGVSGVSGVSGASGASGGADSSPPIVAGRAPHAPLVEAPIARGGTPGEAFAGESFENAAPILQVRNSFVIAPDEQGVVIIDQHALHERVMFEYLSQRVLAGPLESQHMLAPAPVAIGQAQAELLPALTPLLAKIGLELDLLGPTTLGVRAFPSFLFERNVEVEGFVVDLLRMAEAGELGPLDASADLASAGEQALREVLDMMSCKAAIKAGDRLSGMELTELLKLREDVERSSNCPHGRPTSIRLTIRELERLFGRA